MNRKVESVLRFINLTASGLLAGSLGFGEKALVPGWREELPKADQDFVINGEKRAGEYTDEDYENDRWYGVRGFFRWLESKTYKMHVRVLLSRYRSYRTCPVCDGSRVLLGHLGDSRAYLLRDGALLPVSKDHTWVQQLIDAGQLSRDEAVCHPWRNVVLRSLDGNPASDSEDVDVVDLEVREGDRLLLCSDGLTELVDESRIAEVLRLVDPQSAAAVLTQSALGAGGHDNVTCVVLDVVDGPAVSGDGLILGAMRDLANVVDPAWVHEPAS